MNRNIETMTHPLLPFLQIDSLLIFVESATSLLILRLGQLFEQSLENGMGREQVGRKLSLPPVSSLCIHEFWQKLLELLSRSAVGQENVPDNHTIYIFP
jgi:hypothetical protein